MEHDVCREIRYNPLNDGRRRYEWQAGRQLKKVYVKADLKEGTKPGVDEQSGTVLKIAWSNGNLISGSVTSTQASAEVTRNGEDVTGEYAASAFAWKRDSGNAGADNTWNAAHAGKKAITLTAADLSGDVKISCTLTGSGATYGSITVDDNMYASHTPGGLDANDVFAIENGELKVTTSRGEMYALQDGEVKGAGAKLNGTITAQSKLFASQPEDVVEFAYDHNGLRTQKKVTKANGTVETTDYTLHGKPVTHLTRGSDEMHFFYDVQSRPAMVNFNGTLYSYIHNLQGDIVGIIDSNGELVVEYKYDAWGKPVLVRTLTTAYEALAELNPFRYRGYVWDDEIQMYWLRNRYYWPKVQRFVNLDIILGNIGTVLAHSGWLYCLNKPTLYVDSDGLLSELPAGSFVHDWLGILFLGWYLFGNGIKRKLSSKVVGDYMRNAPVENHGSSEPMTLSQYTHSLLKPYAAGMEEGETRTVELVERVSLENGEGIVGYNYLHGVNMDAGGYVVSATITYSCGYINYDVTCTWNDIMDPNYQYESDQLKDEIAHLIPFANPTDYVVSITWNDRFIDYITGTSVPLHDLKG